MLLVVLVATVTGCANRYQGSRLRVCGTLLHQGREAFPLIDPHAPSEAESRAAPPPGRRLPDRSQVRPSWFVRVSSGCDHGVQVSVAPAAGLGLYGVALAKDGGVAAIGLSATDGNVTTRVWAYRNGRLIGTTPLPAPSP